ncbi:MAG: hypothetical protein IKW39_03240 [Alphaproteobacteria bacterium]|nr:hypothetical protein [Alphaproteobacteria bacterium]
MSGLNQENIFGGENIESGDVHRSFLLDKKENDDILSVGEKEGNIEGLQHRKNNLFEVEQGEDGSDLIKSKNYVQDEMLENVFDEDSLEGKIRYLENQTNLDILDINSIDVDENRPVSFMQKIGDLASDKFFYNKFINDIEKIGEDFARYKWAYDEGKFGEFDGKKFMGEAFKAGLRGAGSGSLRMAGNVLNVIGSNLENNTLLSGLVSGGAGIFMSDAKKIFRELGNVLYDYALEVENSPLLAPSFEAYQEDPNWMSVANVIGQGSGSVISMGGISKVIGSKATYGLFAVGGGGEVFIESLEKDGDINKANVLGGLSGSATYVIDRIFNPLPKQLEKGVKKTSSLIAKEMLGAPLREAGSEVLQQIVAENFVRKVGIDDTQVLFEGVIESAIGAMAGNAVVSSVDGGIYFAQKGLNEVEKRIKQKGVSGEEIELYKKNMLEFIKSKPDAFEKVLKYNLDRNIEEIIKATKNKKEKKEVKKEFESLPRIYDKMYERFKSVVDDDVAKASARLFEANALFWHKEGGIKRYLELLEGFLPEVKKENFEQFVADGRLKNADFQFVGIKAQGLDFDKLALFRKMEREKKDPQFIWKYTGFVRGDDGKIRGEISSNDVRLKILNTQNFESDEAIYQGEIIKDLEVLQQRLAYSLISRNASSYVSLFRDFYDYLKSLDDEFGEFKVGQNGEYPILNRMDFQNVRDEKLEVRRRYEDILLENIYEDYKNGETDFSDEEIKYIEGVKEKERFDEFFSKYWDLSKEKALDKFSKDFKSSGSEWATSKEFLNRLTKLSLEFEDKRNKRTEELEKFGILDKSRFYRDLNIDEIYRIYLAKNQDMDEERPIKDYKPERYRKVYEKPISYGERFLADKHYDFIVDKPREEILSYLENIEKYYRLERYLDNIKKNEHNQAIENNDILGASIEKSNEDVSDKDLLIHNGKSFRLDDVLEYDELFKNYPDLKDSKVSFTRLLKGEPYHFYWNKDDGYVFEIDAEQCNYKMLSKILVKGTNFAIQHKEGFDYSLTEKQRQNYMDRHIYWAKRAIADEAKFELSDFLIRNGIVDDESDVEKYWKFTTLPISMLNIYRSESVDADKLIFPGYVKYGEIDFDKLTEDITQKFDKVENYHQENIKRQMMADLFSFKERIAKKIMYTARRESGYRDIGLAWAGVATQGKSDENALFDAKKVRLKYVRKSPFLHLENRMEEKMDFNIENKSDVINHIIDEDIIYKKDRRIIDFLDKRAALGAYDFGNNVIAFFENGRTETILHECFHYFYEFLKKNKRDENMHVSDVFDIVDEIKADFLGRYNVEKQNGKFYAVYKDGSGVLEQLPLGFSTKEELLESVAKEIFVERLLRMMDGKSINIAEVDENDFKQNKDNSFGEDINNYNSSVYVNADLLHGAGRIYFKWLKYMTRALEITKKKSGLGGKKVLKTIGVK